MNTVNSDRLAFQTVSEWRPSLDRNTNLRNYLDTPTMDDDRIGETDSNSELVQVIVPNLSVQEAIKRAGEGNGISEDSVRVIGYPKYLFDYDCSLDRKLLSDRNVSISITIDAITGGRLRNDVYPDLEDRSLPKEAVLQPRLVRDDAVEKARSLIRKYISFHYPTYVMMSGMPEMEIVREDLAFGLYWLIPESDNETESNRVSVIDTISGEVIESSIKIDDINTSDLM